MATSALGPVGVGPALDTYCRPSSPVAPGPFAKVLQQYLGQASAQQASADQAVLDLATGKTEEIHQVMLAVAKADLTFRTILEVRNRLTEAYQEISRMQV